VDHSRILRRITGFIYLVYIAIKKTDSNHLPQARGKSEWQGRNYWLNAL